MAFPKLHELVADFKAWRRGEKRVAKYGTRGRVYADKEGKSTSKRPGADTKAKFKVVVTPSRVYSKKLNKWLTVEEYQKLTGATNG